MDRKPKKKLFIILTLIVICIIFFAALRYIQYMKSIYDAKIEFNEIMRVENEEVPNLMCESLKDDSLIKNIEVTIHSSIVPEGDYDWCNWTEDCVVTYIVADSFDTLSQREQYEFIDKHGDNVYYVKKNITQQLIPQHSYYDSPIAEKNDMLQKIYGQVVLPEENYDIYFKTSKNTYKYCGADNLMNINGKEIQAYSDSTKYSLDTPYVGMDAANITETRLGSYTSMEECRDYSALRPEHRSVTYYWRDTSGDLLFEAYALAGEVISTTDFRVKPIISHGPNDKYN